MADSFLSRNDKPAQTGAGSSFMPAAPAAAPAAAYGNPYGGQQYGGQQFDPRYSQQTAHMIYQELGYRDGNPSEIDVFSDIVRSASPVARFLTAGDSGMIGLQVLAQFFSTMLDYKLVSFFKDFKLSIVQDESGAMHIAPALEQDTERGKELNSTTMAEVSSDLTSITQTLQRDLLQSANHTLTSHREAAKIISQQGGISQMLDEASGKRGGGPGIVSSVLNFGLRTAGVPVPPATGGMPPPPPGR
jgi:hypothetical protein